MVEYQYVYFMQKVSKIYPGGKQVLNNITLQFLPNAKIGILGENGAGKSTLLKIMGGLDNDFNGEAKPADGIKVGYLPQEPQLDKKKTVGENIAEGLGEIKKIVDEFNAISMKLGEVTDNDEMMQLIDTQAELQEQIDAHNAWDLDAQIDMAMEALRCPSKEQKIDHLSGGELRRVALCQLLLSKPDMLLLDEPTNHLDAESIAWLERYLSNYQGCVVMVTHDRYFLDNVTGWILELDRGHGIPYEGNYSSWLEQKEKRLQQEGRDQASKARYLAQEREWISKSPKARQAKSKARINAYEELLNQQYDKKNTTEQIFIPNGPRLGNVVLKAENLRKSYGDKLLFDDLSFTLPAGGIVGIIGGNGAGKTTLSRLMINQEQADKGTLTIGDTVQMGYVDQSRDSLNDNHNVWQEISGGQDTLMVGGREMNSRAYVASFNFKGPDQQKKIGVLSGGERNRVHLAKMLKSGANLLLLDEPTNDLDLDTLRALEEALFAFAGSAVIISHDRWFLDRLATHILAFEGESQVVWFEGNYDDYEKDKKKRLGIDVMQPTPVKFRKFDRNT